MSRHCVAQMGLIQHLATVNIRGKASQTASYEPRHGVVAPGGTQVRRISPGEELLHHPSISKSAQPRVQYIYPDQSRSIRNFRSLLLKMGSGVVNGHLWGVLSPVIFRVPLITHKPAD